MWRISKSGGREGEEELEDRGGQREMHTTVILKYYAQVGGVLAKAGARKEKPGKGISRLGSKGGE